MGETWKALNLPAENPSSGSCGSHMLNLLLGTLVTCLKHSSAEGKIANKVFDAIKESDTSELYLRESCALANQHLWRQLSLLVAPGNYSQICVSRPALGTLLVQGPGLFQQLSV